MSKKQVKIIFIDSDDEEITEEEFNKDKKIITTLYSDGAMNKNTGNEAWGSVVDQDGVDMIGLYHSFINDMKSKDEILPKGIGKRKVILAKFNDVSSQQHNGAELMALVVALRISCNIKSIKTIKCDSSVVISWATKGPLPKTKKNMDINKLKYIEEAIELRKRFLYQGGIIEKISGDDNKADLGYH